MDIVVNLDPHGPVSLSRRLSDALRRAILEGRLKSGSSMPSVRDIAANLRVSRHTVLKAFADLERQGFIRTIKGAGTFINDQLPGDLSELLERKPAQTAVERQLDYAPYARQVMAVAQTETNRSTPGTILYPTTYGVPPAELLPVREWRRLMLHHCRQRDLASQAYKFEPLGNYELRAAICDYLQRARAVRCTPEQVIVFAGRQICLDLLASLLVDAGDVVAFEEPSYPKARMILQSRGAQLIGVPVDGSGIMVGQLAASRQSARIVYVTPSHHDPTGVVMSLERRKQLIEYAGSNNALIIEDDYDHEYHYGGKPISSMQGMDDSGRVIYIGSFFSTLHVLTRLAFAVVPQWLHPVVGLAKQHLERALPVLEQFALTDFINEGHMEKHIRRRHALYARRRQALTYALTKTFGANLQIMPPGAGTHLLIRFRSRQDESAVLAAAAGSQLSLASTRLFYMQEPSEPEFLVPFMGLEESQAQPKVEAFAQALQASEVAG